MKSEFNLSRDNRARELLGLGKDFIIDDEKLAKLFPTDNLRKIFDSISADTLPQKTAIRHKKELVCEVRERDLLSQDIIKNNLTLYIGSGTDLEFPLSLGCRRVIMVDPEFSKQDIIEKIKNKITSLTNKPVSLLENRASFSFDFGQGDEIVTLELEPKVVSPASNEQIERHGKYSLNSNVGMILGYRSTGQELDHAYLNKLINGGFIIVQGGINYSKDNFESVGLENEENQSHFTILRKLEKI